MIKLAASILIGYFVGLWLAPELFSVDITETAWSNIWVYVYLLFWVFILLINLMKSFFVFAAVLIGAFLLIWLFVGNK